LTESTELAPREEHALAAAGARVDETSLTFNDPASLSFGDFAKIAQEFLSPLGVGYPWWVGDLLNMAEDVCGEEWAQLETYLPNSPQTCANYKSIAKHIPRSRRRGLHLSVAEPVAYMEPKKRDELISQAIANDWKREDMREAARAAKAGLPLKAGPGELLPPSRPTICPHCGHELEER
jgi:hypothetical protein